MSRQNEIKRLITEHHRRLQHLKEKEARFGINTPSEILIEIEDIEATLEELQTELNEARELSETLETISKVDNGQSSFKIRVWTEAGTKKSIRDISIVPHGSTESYQLGDEITINFTASQDCYLTLINIGTSGKITILFPNAFIQENFIRANQVYSIPGQEYPFLYKLTGPIGTEKIKVIATIKPVNLIEKDFSKLGDLAFYGATGQRAIRDIEIVAKKINTTPLEEWAEDNCMFDVRDK